MVWANTTKGDTYRHLDGTLITDDEFTDLIYGYVTAATWTSLEHPCHTCGGTGSAGGADLCRECEEGYLKDHGSAPYEYGPDALAPETLAEITADLRDFVRANLSDLAAYAEFMGPLFDPYEGTDCSAWERAGHDLYLTSAGHGTGFWDRGLPDDLGDRLTEASKSADAENLCLWLGADGVIRS